MGRNICREVPLKRHTEMSAFHNIAKNLDYSLRVSDAKSVLVASDRAKEGKSTFIKDCLPVFCGLYKRKVLILDFQPERNDLLEKELKSKSSASGLHYLHVDEIGTSSDMSQPEIAKALANYLKEASQNYDQVFINIKTTRAAELTVIPDVPIDGAIIVRSNSTLGSNEFPVTTEIKDRDIPVLGIIMNEGA